VKPLVVSEALATPSAVAAALPSAAATAATAPPGPRTLSGQAMAAVVAVAAVVTGAVAGVVSLLVAAEQTPAGAAEGSKSAGSKATAKGGAKAVFAAEGDRRAGVRSDQGSARFPPLFGARPGEDERRMAVGLPHAQPPQDLALPLRLQGNLRNLNSGKIGVREGQKGSYR